MHGTGQRRLEVGGHALVPGCPKHWTIQPWTQIRAEMHRMITMHACPRQTDRRTDRRMNIMAVARRFVLTNASRVLTVLLYVLRTLYVVVVLRHGPRAMAGTHMNGTTLM